ncbi:MAG: UDP-glucose/GDP-mannose dehydrogenase family protein [Candidatus Kerfeldbacteria bacterium]|nr:UDP-glucose/GDP-mannose dehydrogenase family protein [Candidatus Kerfeldbacteria bacterium]
MKIAMLGTGYVGLVTGTCFADIGHDVTCVDIDPQKIETLQHGGVPFHEPGLSELVTKNVQNQRLKFTTNLAEAVPDAQVVFIAVGTPPLPDGRADLRYVRKAAKDIAGLIRSYTVVVNKSTVPVGTAREVHRILEKTLQPSLFDVVSCPEFLREGTAIVDFMEPDRVVIGAESPRAEEVMKAVFEPLHAEHVVMTNIESSEMIKYAANAFLATKISFINEIANLCEKVGANVEKVAEGIGLDTRIGSKFLRAGLGYGGSCFPKDVRALRQIAGLNGYDFKLLRAVIDVNNDQRLRVARKLMRDLPDLNGKTIAVLGLAFKSNTDDIRESASIDMIRDLTERGALVHTYDPVATENAKAVLNGQVKYFEDAVSCVSGCDAVIIATEWPEFAELDWGTIGTTLKSKVMVDGRNLLDPLKMHALGYSYQSIGRERL